MAIRYAEGCIKATNESGYQQRRTKRRNQRRRGGEVETAWQDEVGGKEGGEEVEEQAEDAGRWSGLLILASDTFIQARSALNG